MKHQKAPNRLQTRLEARQNVGAQVIAAITVSSECACILFNAARMIHGWAYQHRTVCARRFSQSLHTRATGRIKTAPVSIRVGGDKGAPLATK